MGAQKYGTLPTNPLGGFDVGNEDITRLTQAVVDFIGWLSATGNSKKLKGDYDHTLIEFIVFALRENMNVGMHFAQAPTTYSGFGLGPRDPSLNLPVR